MSRSTNGPRRRQVPRGPAAHLARSLRDRRLTLALTQQAVADLADVSRGVVRELESGRGGTSIGAATAVAEVLGLHLTVAPRRPGGEHDE